MKFLQYDSKFMTVFRKVTNYFLLGIIWIVACAPILTAGAATAAMLLTAERSIHEDEDKLIKPFFHYFRREFKQSTALCLIQLVIIAVLAFYAIIVFQSEMFVLLKALSYIIIALIFMWTQLWIPYASKFNDNLKTIMINCLRINIAHLGTSVLRVLLMAAALLGVAFSLALFEPIALIIPGVYIFVETLILRKLYTKLLPQVEAQVTVQEVSRDTMQ